MKGKIKSFLVAALFASGLAFVPSASAEEHVNLWPLYMYDKGTHDFIWPLGQYKDSTDWRFFPIVRYGSRFCVFPELWFGSESFAVLPLYARYDFSEGTLFPVVGWEKKSDLTMHSIFPLYWYSNRPQSGRFLFWAACGLGGYAERNGKMRAHWMLPVYCAWNDGDFFSLPYSRSSHADGTDEAYLCGLFGRTIAASGETTDHWVFPLYGKIGGDFISLPYFREKLNNDSYNWFSLPLLSGGEVRPERSSAVYLMGLAGYNHDNIISEHWCAPFYYVNDRGTFVSALYGQTERARWGLPGWYSDEHVFASPLWYHHTDENGEIDRWILPWLLSGGFSKDGITKRAFLLNAAGTISTGKGYFASWCLPLYFKDNDGTFISALYGHNRESQWCFPLWYTDEKSLFSILWCHTKADDGSLERWVIPPLLSGGSKDKASFLLGLAGYNRDKDVLEHWCAPLYYANDKGTFTTALFGKTKTSNWLLPLWYVDDESFVSLPYAHSRDRVGKSDTYVVLPLLSGYTKYDDGRANTSVLLLYGHGSDEQGKVKRDYLFPLYHYNGENGDFTSILYGRGTHGSHVEQWWATPIVGSYSGSKTGGWFFPLFNRKKDVSYDADMKRFDSPTIPEDVTFDYDVQTWTNSYTREVSVYTNVNASVRVDSHIRGSFLLGSDHDSFVRGSAEGNKYTLFAHSKHGNKLIYNREVSRSARYDIKTRRKFWDETQSETFALCGLFYDSRAVNVDGEVKRAHTCVLGKVWEREENDGNVMVDAFPGFSYESKTNGYSKTSFLWRFYRHETDPEKGTKLDVLFIPIIRSEK